MSEEEAVPNEQIRTTRIAIADRASITDPRRQKSFATNQGVRLFVRQEVAQTNKFVAEQLQGITRAMELMARDAERLQKELMRSTTQLYETTDMIQTNLEVLNHRWYNRLALRCLDIWDGFTLWVRTKFIVPMPLTPAEVMMHPSDTDELDITAAKNPDVIQDAIESAGLDDRFTTESETDGVVVIRDKSSGVKLMLLKDEEK